MKAKVIIAAVLIAASSAFAFEPISDVAYLNRYRTLMTYRVSHQPYMALQEWYRVHFEGRTEALIMEDYGQVQLDNIALEVISIRLNAIRNHK
jgi:hypothetical protein